MNETATLPATIRARVHEDAIGRVTRFFNATPADTLGELLQNARRAGATRVDIEIADGRVAVTDDGDGIADPAALLAFGQTAWRGETARREDPAGMGVYALARCPDVAIRSRCRPRTAGGPAGPGWQVRLTPAHFLGEEAAAVETIADKETPFGTRVVFSDDRATEGDARRAARHFPLPVTCGGKEIERVDFLKGSVYTEEWRGLLIGIRTNEPSYGTRPEFNFHGIVIGGSRLPVTRSIDAHWYARADIVNSPELELVLPARKEIVETPFVDQLRTACRRAAFRAMLACDEPVDVSVLTHAEASALGVQLPDARARLAPWRPTSSNELSYLRREPERRVDLPPDAIVVDKDIPVCDQHALWRAATRAGIAGRLVRREPQFAGYGWYDSLTRAASMTTAFTLGGEARTVEGLRERGNPPQTCRPETMMITLHTVDADGRKDAIDLPADVAFGDDDACWPEDIGLLVTADSGIEAPELAELMHDACFSFSDDAGADSYETQSENFRYNAMDRAVELLESPEEARLSSIRTNVERWILPYVLHKASVTIRILPNWKIEVHTAPAPAAE